MQKRQTRGYTLIEMVIYVALVGAMAIFVISSVIYVYRAFVSARLERTISQNADVALESMVREIRAASSTDPAVSVFKTHPGVLQIGQKKFFLAGSILQLQNGSASPQPLTTADVQVTNLIFYDASTTSTTTPSEIVTIRMSLQAGTGILARTRNYFASAVLRGEY